MEHTLQVPGFEERQLVIRQKGLLGSMELLDNGVAAVPLTRSRRQREFALLQGDGREVAATVHNSLFGQISAVTINGQHLEIPHIRDVTHIALMLPLFLLEVFGGLIGVAVGLLGILLSAVVCMGNRPPASKVAICIGICAGAWILYSIVALVFVHGMMASL